MKFTDREGKNKEIPSFLYYHTDPQRLSWTNGIVVSYESGLAEQIVHIVTWYPSHLRKVCMVKPALSKHLLEMWFWILPKVYMRKSSLTDYNNLFCNKTNLYAYVSQIVHTGTGDIQCNEWSNESIQFTMIYQTTGNHTCPAFPTKHSRLLADKMDSTKWWS